MKKFYSFLILTLTSTAFLSADVFMTELTDPQNSSDAGRYVELYNNGSSDVDLSTGWKIQRWTNGNADPTASSIKDLTGTIAAGGFYIICNDAGKYNTTYGLTCDQDIGTGGAADSNGDDNMAILNPSGEIADMFGVAGEDGTGTGHEFEDGRAERAESNTSASSTWDESGWNIDNDSGGGDGNQYAPEGFDPGEWIGAGEVVSSCEDETACNFGDEGDCTYAETGYDCDGNLLEEPCVTIDSAEVSGSVLNVAVTGVNLQEGDHYHAQVDGDSAGMFYSDSFSIDIECAGNEHELTVVVADGSHSEYTDACSSDTSLFTSNSTDCNGDCGGTAETDACGECGGDDSSCSVNVTFSVDMSLEGVTGDIKIRTSTENGEYSPSDWYVMDDSDGDLIYSYTFQLITGIEYGYNFNNSDGSGYESGDDLGDCAGGNYGNDRYITPGDSDTTVDTVCWESCAACPEDIPGCTDETALNYNPNATTDDGSCLYDWPDLDTIFFSEYAEGSSNNKYLEIYNAGDGDVDLSGYSLSSCSNGCNDGVSWDYPDNVTFDAGTTVAAGDVYVVCHGSADDVILAECDQTFTYLSNGDDVFALTQLGSGIVLDIIGEIGDDPGSGWEVAGVANGTKDHTLVRNSSVGSGNSGDWASSAGDADDSEWTVFDQNTWDYLGSHPHEFTTDVSGCMDEWACNYNADATVDDGSCTYEDDNYDCDGNCTAWVDCAGECGGIDTSCWGNDPALVGTWDYSGITDCLDADTLYDTTFYICTSDGSTYGTESDCSDQCSGECVSETMQMWDYVTFGEDGSLTFGFGGEENTGGTWGTYDGQLCETYIEEDDNGEEYTGANCIGIYYFSNAFGGALVVEVNDAELPFLEGDCAAVVVTPSDSCDGMLGDVNGDGALLVTDIVVILNAILGASELDECQLLLADYNNDAVVNVLDIIQIMNAILGNTAKLSDATSATLNKTDSALSISANGYVGGVQMTLSHGADFAIDITDNALVADYRTEGNQTILVVVAPEGEDLFTYSGDFEIVEMIVANSHSEISVGQPTVFALSAAYPNPFNPTTSLSLNLPESGYVSVKVYNVMGYEIATLADGYMNGYNTLTWDASDASSGMYFVRAEYAGNIATQKLMLLK